MGCCLGLTLTNQFCALARPCDGSEIGTELGDRPIDRGY